MSLQKALKFIFKYFNTLALMPRVFSGVVTSKNTNRVSVYEDMVGSIDIVVSQLSHVETFVSVPTRLEDV